MSVKQNLIAAKALIDTPEKWGKGGKMYSGCLCVAQAVREASEANRCFGVPREEMGVLTSVLPSSFEDDPHDWNGRLVQFNDHPDTTHADIMALFDRAIEACDD